MISGRVVTSALIATAVCVSLAACGSHATDSSDSGIASVATDASPEAGTPGSNSTTVNLNDHRATAAWAESINASTNSKCGSIEATEAMMRCVQDEVHGTTVAISGPVVAASTTGNAIVAIVVGSDNPKLTPITDVYPNPPLPYGITFMCHLSDLADCGSVNVGDSISVAGPYEGPIPGGPAGLTNASAESIQIQ